MQANIAHLFGSVTPSSSVFLRQIIAEKHFSSSMPASESVEHPTKIFEGTIYFVNARLAGIVTILLAKASSSQVTINRYYFLPKDWIVIIISALLLEVPC